MIETPDTTNAQAADAEALETEAEAVEPAETEATLATSATLKPVADAPNQPVRKANKFLADLSRAMQAAAESARAETMTRFDAEAKSVVDEIRAGATDEVAELRRKADDDVAAIRDWSKAEIARVREEAEGRIAARKRSLDGEVETHAGTVDARVERVTAVVAAFEAQMAAFFEHLNAEEDPTRIATMAEAMPDAPSLSEIAASIEPAPASSPWQPPAPTTFETPTTDSAESGSGTDMDFAAAEAEAASYTGDLETEELPDADPGETETPLNGGLPTLEEDRIHLADVASSRVIVSGLVSVANIANFKRSLGRTPGVSSIAVSSGPDGDFIFTVGHTLGTQLSHSVRELSGFDIEITGESDDAINVAAKDRDTID
jgi:hypothetical protein